jgi:hypothetical protein
MLILFILIFEIYFYIIKKNYQFSIFKDEFLINYII